MTLVKICGVTLPDDAARVAAAGVDFIGLNFWPRSKRYLDPARAPMIAGVVRSTGPAKLVAVIQLHGDEDPDRCNAIARALYRPVWKAVAVATSRDTERLDVWPVEAILLDAPVAGRGGAGVAFDHALAREARDRHPARSFVLAGGLDPSNVAAAIALVRPWCVDVASGVEAAAGIKDAAKVTAFVAAVRGAA